MANQITATESGKVITLTTNGYSIASATSVNLLVLAPGATSTSSLPCTVNADGVSCQRITASTDFPTAGTWQIQLQVIGPGTITLYSLTSKLTVYPVL